MSKSRVRKEKWEKAVKFEKTGKKIESFISIAAIVGLTIVPIIFRLCSVEFVSPQITNTTSADTEIINDVFTHIKSLILYPLTGLLVAAFCIRLAVFSPMNGNSGEGVAAATAAVGNANGNGIGNYKEFRLTRYDAAIMVLVVFLLMSCLMSEYIVVAFTGFAYMMDGVVGHLSYAALFFLGFHVFSRSRYRDGFMIPLYTAGILNMLISVLNFTGAEMINNPLIKLILGVPVNATAVDAQAFSSTFGNVNYLSGFGGVLYAVFLTRLLFAESKKTLILSFIMVGAAFSVVVASLSSSGFLTVVAVTPIILLLAALSGITVKKVALAASAVALCGVILVSLGLFNSVVFDETLGMVHALPDFSAEAVIQEEPAESDTVSPGVLSLTASSTEIRSSRALSAEVMSISMQAPIRTDGARPVKIKSLSASRLSAGFRAEAAEPTVTPPSELAQTERPQPELPQPELPQEFPEPGLAPGTGRLYIWEKTFELISRRPIFGYGMDTLAYAFPQNDLDKVAGLGMYSTYVTKPHNAFINYAYGAGVPALFAFMALCGFGIAAFVNYYFKVRASDGKYDLMIMSALIGWVAYMIQALVNDDLISTAPLWWTLYGVGTGMMYGKTKFTQERI